MLPKRKAPPTMKRRDSNGLAYRYASSRFTPFYDTPYQDSLRSPWRSRFFASPRLFRRFIWCTLLPLIAVAVFVAAFTTDNRPTTWLYHSFDAWAGSAPPRMPNRAPKLPLAAPVPCLGPRGQLLGNSTDDDLHPVSLAIRKCIPGCLALNIVPCHTDAYPQPTLRPLRALMMSSAWTRRG